MERWRGRVAMVTGASSGIGAAITYQLLDAGVNVVGVARRAEQIEEAVTKARNDAASRGRVRETKTPPGKLYCQKCDVSNEDDILAVFKWIKENVGGPDILVNNAGLGGDTPLTSAPTEEWRRLLNVNVLGLSICTREAVQSMRARSMDDGHIVHISSVAGHKLPGGTALAFYAATKHAVRVLTEGLRKDLVANKNRIKVTSVSPGFVRTGFIDNLSRFDSSSNEVWFNNPHLLPEDIADAVLYSLGTPPHVQVHEMIVKPVGEDF